MITVAQALRRLGVVLVVGPVCLSLAAPQAIAQGVMIDPDSPAGKEYSIPLERARQEGAGLDEKGRRTVKITQESRGNGKPPPPFGVGVLPASAAEGNSTDTSSSRESSSRSNREQRLASKALQAEHQTAVTTAGIPLGVLLLGLLLGLGVRRLARRP